MWDFRGSFFGGFSVDLLGWAIFFELAGVLRMWWFACKGEFEIGLELWFWIELVRS